MDKKETEYFKLYVHFAILPKIPPQGDEKNTPESQKCTIDFLQLY